MKQLAKLMVLGISLILVLSACGGGNNKGSNTEQASGSPTASGTESASATESSKPLDPVELEWNYLVVEAPSDISTVQDAVNKITKEKINATIKLNPIVLGDYEQKLNTIVASGEETDIIWTSNWWWNYASNQAKGAFIPLDELIDKYAPDLKASLPQYVFDAPKIGGKIYAIPNYQTVASREGFIIQKRFVDKYKLDISTIKKFEDLEPFLAQVKAGEPGIVPIGMDYTGLFFGLQHAIGIEQIDKKGIAVSLDAPDKVFNVFESPLYSNYLNVMRSWYTKGYINKDAATLKNFIDLTKTGKVAVMYHNGLIPGSEPSFKANGGGKEDVVLVPLTDYYIPSTGPLGTLNAISRTSKNPERAMMFLNLLNTDVELYNTMVYGVEGKHYTKENGVVEINKDAGYVQNNIDWIFGNKFNEYLLEGTDPSIVEQQKQINLTAQASPNMGFTFDPSPVSAEVANITTVYDQYSPGLATGTIDPAKKLAEFQDKLKRAGIEKVIAEAQKQLDAYYSTKK